MFAKERQEKIYKIIQKNGAVSTSDLVNMFDVSIETVRRDLLCMEENGMVNRVHGGAVAKGGMKSFDTLKQRNTENNTQKRELAEKAVQFINDGEYIAVDSGSTAIIFAEVLKEKFSKLTVVTHSIDVFSILCNHEEFNVILCGGSFDRNENSLFGPLAADTLHNLHVQKAFVFPSAVSLKFGICDFQSNLFQVQRTYLDISDSVYILADSSKFEQQALLKMSDMRSEFIYITDSGLKEDLKRLYTENGITVFS